MWHNFKSYRKEFKKKFICMLLWLKDVVIDRAFSEVTGSKMCNTWIDLRCNARVKSTRIKGVSEKEPWSFLVAVLPCPPCTVSSLWCLSATPSLLEASQLWTESSINCVMVCVHMTPSPL